MKNKLLILIAVLVISLTPAITLGQAPDLGTTSNFVLFSSNGAVVNTGKSQITGKVGTNNGPTTGFGNVNGGMHAGDGVTAQASTDLLSLYNELDATTPNFFLATPLGNGQILNAGVYSVSGATTMNLDLILDAQGNSSAIFIILIEGSFSTNANSKVKLVNGAQACNVFWKIEGLLDMATKTSMKGTLVVNNAAINMTTGNILEGRVLTTTGALSVNGTEAFTPIGCGSPVLKGPTAPTLSSVGCYGIFSTDGPVKNSGITNVKGDVGANVGLTTGFDPLLVEGEIHPTPDGSTAQAAADLNVAYNYLNGLAHDIELLYPAQFGANLVLTPHTYILNGATTFTDTLFLNAQGNANAVFVIKINGALSTSTYSTVVLTNGTKAENVYWLVNGAVELNDYSVFNGTIISQGAINMKTGATINGRTLTGVGAIEINAINSAASISSDCGSQTIEKPILTSPSNDSTINTQSVTLEWEVMANADKYILDVSKDASFATKIINAEELTTTTRNLTNLAWDTTIYWRVKAVVNGNQSEWSDTWHFNVVELPKVVLLSPVNDSTINTQSVTLEWEIVANADKYILDVSKDASFAFKIINAEELTTTTRNLTNLAWDTTIYWRVKAVVNGSETEWSEIWHFTPTENAQPEKPILISPSNDSKINKQSVTLVWKVMANADKYILDVSKDAAFSTKIVNAEELTTNTRNLTSLAWDQTIYWRVKAVVNGSETEWSEIWHFTPTENAQPEKPILISPSNDSKINKQSVTLVWKVMANADKYILDVSKDASFSTKIVNSEESTTTTRNLTNLAWDQTIYWRVKAVVNGSETEWSEIWHFTPTENAQLPATPILTSPVDGAINQETSSILFTWQQAQYANTYEFELSTKNNFSVIIHQKTNITGTTHNVVSFSSDTEYFWRVRAVNDDGKSDWSNVSSFITSKSGTSSVKEGVMNGKQYNLSPNPAVDILQIKVSADNLSLNEIIIYNISGKEILKRNNNIYNVNQETIDISNLQTGVYYIKLVSNNENTTIRFIKK